MKTKRQVPYIKPSLKPIRPKPQILTESKDKQHSLALVSSSVIVKSSLGQIDLPQNSCHISHVQKGTLFNCSEKNKSVPYAIISKCQKLPNFTKYESCVKGELSSKCDVKDVTGWGNDLQQALFIPDTSKIDIPKKINTSNLVKPYIINLGHTIDANFKEVKHDKNKSSADNGTSSCTKQQFHSLAQHRPTVNKCIDNCNNAFKQNSNLLSEKAGETREKISLTENNLKLALIKTKPKLCKKIFDKRLNIILTENFENDSENTLKKKESAILKTFAKIAPCSPEYTNKARNFFTIKRNGKRSLVVCRNAKERQLQFLPTIECNNDRCCPNLLNEFNMHKHSVLNILQDKIEKSKCKNALFFNSLNDSYDGSIDNHIPSTQLNSDLEIINKIKETQDKNNLEIIAGDLNAEINHADKKTEAKQLLNFSEDDFDSNLLNENKYLKHVIPAAVTECNFSQYKKISLGKKTTAKIGTDYPTVKEASENANCSLIKITVTKEQRVKKELDLPVTNSKFDLWTNSMSCQAKEILQKYPRIAPHLNVMQNKSQSSLDIRSEKNTASYQESSNDTLLENQTKYLSVFKRVINGNIKSKEENLTFSSNKCDLENIGQEKNSKRLKVSCNAYSKETQHEGVPSRRIKCFSQHLLLKNSKKDSKQQESGGSCNNSHCVREVKITKSCCAAENNCCSTIITSFPKTADRCVPLHSSSPTDNIDTKLLTFTELTDLSQKLGEKIFHSLSLDEITEKAILEWTESGISISINTSSTNSSSFINNFNLTDCQSEMITSNCCISDSSLQRCTKGTPLYLNLNEMAKFQKQQLKDINCDVSDYVSDKQSDKNNIQNATEDEFYCSNLLFEENILGINNIGKTEFLNCLNLHRSDNVFGISVLFPRILQKIEPDYIENPCVPLHRIIKAFKSLKQYHTKLRNFSKTEHVTPTVATPLCTDFCDEKTLLLSTHSMNEVKPVSKSVKRKCVVIPSDSRHKATCLLIPVQTMLPSSGSSTRNIETSTQCKPCISHDGSFTKFIPIEKPAISMRKTSTLPFSSLPKSVVIKHRTFPHVICAKQTNLAHSKRTAQRNSTILRSQKTTVGDTLKIPSVSVITHCCTSSHHSNFCCNVSNRYHHVTKLV